MGKHHKECVHISPSRGTGSPNQTEFNFSAGACEERDFSLKTL